ncbi:SH3 domain-binding protein 5-like isoform X1 [Glandiceps talaboti]
MTDTEKLPTSEENEQDQDLDPRIKMELDKLNASTNEINKLENELDEARAKFRETVATYTLKLNMMGKKMGKTVKKARPYYLALNEARDAQVEAQAAARQYQQATGVHRAAKETIQLAEERLVSEKDKSFDSAWQEMLNHATMRVMDAEQERAGSEWEHKVKSEKFAQACFKVNQLYKKMKRTISRSKPYYDMVSEFQIKCQQLKQNVLDLQKCVISAKQQYANSLKVLEQISDEIHHSRTIQIPPGPRGVGVGAESNHDSQESSLDINFELASSLGDDFEYDDDLDDVSSTGTDEGDVFTNSVLSGMENMTVNGSDGVSSEKKVPILERHISGQSEELPFCEDYYKDSSKSQLTPTNSVSYEDDDIARIKSSAVNIPKTKVKLSAEGLSITPDSGSPLQSKDIN